MLVLYYAPGACSLVAHCALEEAGLTFETRRLDLMAGDQRTPEYLALNPKGRVPALVTPNGLLTESPAILSYIADLNPEAGVLPAAGFARAQALSHLCYFSSTVHGMGFAGAFRPARFTSDEAAFAGVKAKSLDDIAGRYLPELEGLVSGRAWVMDHFTAVDVYLVVFRRWSIRLGLSVDHLPALAAHAARVAARPACAAVIAREGVRLDG